VTSVTPRDDLPPTLPSMCRLCRLGYRREPGLMRVAFVLTLLSARLDTLLALWLKMIAVADGAGSTPSSPAFRRRRTADALVFAV
jgi:hypothetical protein